MDHYFVFLALAALAILSPGPGVTLTITNSLRYGMRTTVSGILGLVLGAFILAGVSAAGAGLILAASHTAFSFMKYLGAAYLIYLGVRMWINSGKPAERAGPAVSNHKILLLEALTIQLSNPKAIFFFAAIFPQFIDTSSPSFLQFTGLVLPYCILLLIIHSLYALAADKAGRWFSSSKGFRMLNRVGGTAFIFFGLALAGSKL